MDIVGVLSATTTGLCMFLKFPQIATIIASSSVQGLSTLSLMLEFWSYSTTLSYSVYFGYSWKMYSEYPPLLVQDLILFLLMIRNSRSSCDQEHTVKVNGNNNVHDDQIDRREAKKIKGLSGITDEQLIKLFLPVALSIHALIGLRVFPRWVPIAALSTSAPIGVASKGVQLWKIMASRKSGTVSPTSWFLNFISTGCRLTSVWMTVRDLTIMTSLTFSAILNILVAAAALYYRDGRVSGKKNEALPENDRVICDKKNE